MSLGNDFSLYSNQAEKTDEIAVELSEFVFPGLVILLKGDLGSGKTAFTRGLCRVLGASGVRSPSFTIINEYEGKDMNIAHIDLYRLEDGGDLELDIDYYLDREFLVIIEWPQRLSQLPGEEIWKIELEFPEVADLSEDYHMFSKRNIFFNCQGQKACRKLKEFINHSKKGRITE